MTNVVRAAITQTTWTGDKESMLDKHEQFARDAKAQGAQIICFQELFYGPYFGITEDKKYYRFAEPSDGPIVQRFAKLAKELELVMILPIYEEEMTGVYYNTAVVVDSDGTILGQYRKSTGSGRSSTSVRATAATPSSIPPSARWASTSATTGTSPRDGASSR
jgi:beta-ureidopropionase